MKYSKLISFFALAVMLAFSSCKKEEVSDMNEVINPTNPELVTNNVLVPQMQASTYSDEGLDLGCFIVDFPFDLIVDGTTITINDETDFETALPVDAMYVDFAYPLAITYPDGSSASVVDGTALGDAFATCIPDDGWDEDLFPAFLISDLNSCYGMVYPANLVNGTGDVVVAENEDEFVDLIANNYDLYFQFPVSLTDEDGNTVVAANDEELFALLSDCDGINPPGGGGIDPIGDCWDYVYPFDMVDQDGNLVTINNHDDICNAMLNGLILEHVFPLTLENGDGEELVVNNLEELEAAWFDCIFIGGPIDLDVVSVIVNSNLFAGVDCYSLVYPLEYEDEDGNINSIADEAAAQAYVDGTVGFDLVVFPLSLNELATGEVITFTEFQAYFEFLISCQ